MNCLVKKIKGSFRNSNVFIKSAIVIFLVIVMAGLAGGIYNIRRNCEAGSEGKAHSAKGPDRERTEGFQESQPKVASALKNFGEYLKELCREGRQSELESRVISTRLSLEDAALLAERSPLLEHIAYYEEDARTINSQGICILMADVNEDGADDIIEYGPDDYWPLNANMLIIYLGKKDGGFELAYSQPLFDTRIPWNDRIEVVRYDGEAYLFFQSKEWWGDEIAADVYWLMNGRPAGRLKLSHKCSDIDAVIKEEGAYDLSSLTENRMDLYHVAKPSCCNDGYDYHFEWGNGETRIAPWEDEEAYEKAYEKLVDGYVKKYTALQEPYVEESNGLLRYNITDIIDVYESDLNNDGITERYLKCVKELWLRDVGLPEIGLTWGTPYMTGEYYGHHEGRHGLMYYIETEGEETDFLKMCGLDIWAGEMTPQYFWVDRTEGGNVVYIAYQDGEEYRQHIEGYLIQGDRYEMVGAVDYIPQIECSVSYETFGEDLQGVDYMLHRSEDRMSFVVEWNEENSLHESINQSIRELVEKEESGNPDFQGRKIYGTGYHVIQANEEELVVRCWIFAEDEREVILQISVDLVTGECRGSIW